jgi:hypothetical protein
VQEIEYPEQTIEDMKGAPADEPDLPFTPQDDDPGDIAPRDEEDDQ